jgi:SAM-dependent methyltransferase
VDQTRTRRDRRRALASYLTGNGLDVGPGHQPFELPSGTTARYVDRWQPAENRELFPELAGVDFPPPDLVANFDTDRLACVASNSQDFVVCSHVLEHLAEPIGFVAEIYRVLRTGGAVLVVLPDRRRTFDRDQDPTTLDHLVREYAVGVRAVDDDHIRTFLANSGPGAAYLEAPDRPEDLPAFYEWHRRRSIHVHYWTDEEFLPVILFGMDHLGHRWTLVDRLRCEDESDEFGFVLRRSRSPFGRWSRRRFVTAWNAIPKDS